MRLGYLGPEGTFSHEALLASGVPGEPVPLVSNRAVVLAVQDGAVDRALAPLENSVEGAVTATLDALVFEAPGVVLVGELVLDVHHNLIAAPGRALGDVVTVVSHPQPLAQCARWVAERLPGAVTLPASSSAEAVRRVLATPDEPLAAIGTRAAAQLYGAEVLVCDIEDEPGNATRFVWLARTGDGVSEPAGDPGPRRTSIVFSGDGDRSPGWLVGCLSELARRGVNLTRIESRPQRSQLGHYLFHVDVDGAVGTPAVDAALTALRGHCEAVRVLGSYAVASATLRRGHGSPDST